MTELVNDAFLRDSFFKNEDFWLRMKPEGETAEKMLKGDKNLEKTRRVGREELFSARKRYKDGYLGVLDVDDALAPVSCFLLLGMVSDHHVAGDRRVSMEGAEKTMNNEAGCAEVGKTSEDKQLGLGTTSSPDIVGCVRVDIGPLKLPPAPRPLVAPTRVSSTTVVAEEVEKRPRLVLDASFGMMSVKASCNGRGLGSALLREVEKFVCKIAREHQEVVDFVFDLKEEIRAASSASAASRSRSHSHSARSRSHSASGGSSSPASRGGSVPPPHQQESEAGVDEYGIVHHGGGNDSRELEVQQPTTIIIDITMPLINVRPDLFGWYAKRGYEERYDGVEVDLPWDLKPMVAPML